MTHPLAHLAVDVTDKQVRAYLGHGQGNRRVHIKRVGCQGEEVHYYGSTDHADRSHDYWHFAGDRSEIAEQVAAEINANQVLDEYEAALRAVGASYRARMGRHYPAMSLVEVAALLEPGAKVEIEATAVVPAAEVEEG